MIAHLRGQPIVNTPSHTSLPTTFSDLHVVALQDLSYD